MDMGIISEQLAYETLVACVRLIPATWSGNAFYRNLSDMEQRAVERLVTRGIAECRMDVHVIGTRRRLFGLLSKQEHRFVYVCRGPNYLNRTTAAGRDQSGMKPQHTMVSAGSSVCEFRMTSLGNKLRHCLEEGSIDIVKQALECAVCEFQCYLQEWTSAEQNRVDSIEIKSIAAAQATATVGDIHNHQSITLPEHPAPIVNVHVQVPEHATKLKDTNEGSIEEDDDSDTGVGDDSIVANPIDVPKGWLLKSPAELCTIYDVKRDKMRAMLQTKSIKNIKQSSKLYWVDPSAFPKK